MEKFLQAVSNDKDGHIRSFEQLLFSKADLGRTFTYTVEEVNDNKPGISYDAMKATVTVQVTKDGKILKTVVIVYFNSGNATDTNDKRVQQQSGSHQKNLSSNQRNMLYKSRNLILPVINSLMIKLADKYADTNANPYVDKTDNNEKKT